jgi:hypothetical protein
MKLQLDSPDKYPICWIPARDTSAVMATDLLDDVHEQPVDFEKDPNNWNVYTWGRMGKHNIVIVRLPSGEIDAESLTKTIAYMLACISGIKIRLYNSPFDSRGSSS